MREISVKHCVFLSYLTIIRRSLVITWFPDNLNIVPQGISLVAGYLAVYIVCHSWKKLIDLK